MQESSDQNVVFLGLALTRSEAGKLGQDTCQCTNLQQFRHMLNHRRANRAVDMLLICRTASVVYVSLRVTSVKPSDQLPSHGAINRSVSERRVAVRLTQSQ